MEKEEIGRLCSGKHTGFLINKTELKHQLHQLQLGQDILFLLIAFIQLLNDRVKNSTS